MATAELPEELITEILTWLTVKSIKRFRCLSKPLCALIDSPQFVNSHFTKSSRYPNLRKLIFQDRSRTKFHVCDLNPNQEEEFIRLENRVSSPLEAVHGYCKSVVGYCKGLVLLSGGKFIFSVWNPSTRQSINLPDIPLQAPSDNLIHNIIGSGLGYDDSVNDFKAFCIVHVRPKSDVEVWICGLKSNTWKKYQNWEFGHLLLTVHSADYALLGIGCFVPVDGVIYWVCTVMSNKHEIVAFDVKKETYSIQPPPDCSYVTFHVGNRHSTRLHVLEGCLCISYVNTMPLQADLYIRRKDEGGQFSWTQLFSVKRSLFHVRKVWFKTMRVLGYLERGDKIMLDIGTHYLISFDLKEKTFEIVEMDEDFDWKDPILCIESLVPLS